MTWAETCGRCGNELFWWRSRSGYRVCMCCARDPLHALEVLAQRLPGGVKLVQSGRLQAPISYSNKA
jgi:hypothetical protein